MKVSGCFLVALGIFLALLMVVLPQHSAWQIGMIVMLAVGIVGCLLSGLYNLAYRGRVSTDAGATKFAKVVGISLLILAAWIGWIFILTLSGYAH